MDAVQKQVTTLKTSDQKTCINGSHMVGVFEMLQSLRKYVVNNFQLLETININNRFMFLEIKCYVISS